MTHDEMTLTAVQQATGSAMPITKADLAAATEKWQPYRMWVTVLLHVSLRESGASNIRSFGKR